ncbi:hypothetical protein GCM10009730_62100 [Streptomyces albidochromogenes]
MTSENVAESVETSLPSKAVDDQLIDELVGRAQAEALQLTGEGGLLQQLTKRLLQSALAGRDHRPMTTTTRPARTAATPETAPGLRP